MSTLEQEQAVFDSIAAEWAAAQTTASLAVAEPKQETPVASLEIDGPLTEKEVIKIIQSWVTQDAEYELPERRSFEEMIETLQDAGEYRGTDLSVSRLKEIVSAYAPNAPKSVEH